MKNYKVNVILWKGKRSCYSLKSIYFDDKEEALSYYTSKKNDRFVRFAKFMEKSGFDSHGFAQYFTIIEQHINEKSPF